MAEPAQPADRSAYDGQTPGQYWHAQIEAADKAFEKWVEKGKKVVKRYRDERDAIESQRKKFNILWSNTQVTFPALYGRSPKPDVTRRHMDNDPPSRLASMMLERVIEYEIENFDDFDAAMRGVVEDRLLPGRGVSWQRFDPQMVNVEQTAGVTDDQGAPPTDDQAQRIVSAHAPVDYVFWQDFLHSPARTWEEVWWVARAVYMTREEGMDRFGEVFRLVPCEQVESFENWSAGKARAQKAEIEKKAKVYEIWNKRTGIVCWVAKGYPEALDEREDFLKLEGFFPCPKPLFATTTTGTLVPVPDFSEYQDQASELDELTQRIAMLTKACKAVGMFNAEYKEFQRLLNEGVDNRMFPVTDWAAFAEKGGIPGAAQLFDVSPLVKVLEQLYISREAVKQTVYEVTGLSDIIRGATEATETATAQQLKANFGSLRLKSSQQEVARYASDLFRMKAEVICRFYPPELILEMSGVKNTLDGQDPQLVQAALALLKNTPMREFAIQVESDTLGQVDEAQEREQATQFTQAVGVYFKDAVPLLQAAPFMAPLVAELLMFNIRRWRVGRPVEAAFERAMQQMMQSLQQQQQQAGQPDQAEMAKAEADKAKAQATVQKAAIDAQVAPIKAQAETTKAIAGVIAAKEQARNAAVSAASDFGQAKPGTVQ